MVHPVAPVAYPMQPPPVAPMMVAPGVSVLIQNVVGPAQPAYPYAQPAYPQVAAPYPYPAPPAPLQATDARGAEPRGVVGMMRADANQRAMEAVARGGPARILAFVIGATTLGAAATLVGIVALSTAPAVALLALIPLMIIALGAFYFGARAGRGVASHHLEQAILKHAAEHEGMIRLASLARATGRSLRECQVAIDGMVRAGHATVDSDERGVLVYRIPDFVPSEERL